MSRSQIITVALGLAAFAPPAEAQVCDEANTQGALQYLRRLSLDLRGRLPDLAELESVATNGAVDPAIVRAMVRSEDAVGQLRRYHRDLLWTNVMDQRLANNNWLLNASDRDGAARDVWWIRSNGRSSGYRGAQVSCLDEPARFDPQSGAILTTMDPMTNARREGWVMVEPYWAPGTQIKVCAFDAQSAEMGMRGQTAVPCASSVVASCGCGPNLRWCQDGQRTMRRITESMNEQMLRFIDAIVREDRPYTELLLGTEIEINGPLSHYFRYQTGTGGGQVAATPEQGYPMPNLAYSEAQRWEKATRGTRHAGVLTMPGYLLKFASDRGRANRFYEAFLCAHFEAPQGGLPAADDACHAEPDLTKRCGCQHCHIALEPAAAHWGRWAEAGLVPMNEMQFPERNPNCTPPRGAGNNFCRRFYLTEALHPSETPFLGTLLPYVFADEPRKAKIAAGPASIAREAIDSGTFASCTTKKMWTLLMGRAPHDNERETVVALTDRFKANYKLRELVEAIVTRPEYVEAGRFAGKKE